jgi:hypothetical protein
MPESIANPSIARMRTPFAMDRPTSRRHPQPSHGRAPAPILGALWQKLASVGFEIGFPGAPVLDFIEEIGFVLQICIFCVRLSAPYFPDLSPDQTLRAYKWISLRSIRL